MKEKIVVYIKHYVKTYFFSLFSLCLVLFTIGATITFHPHDTSLLYYARNGTCFNMFGYAGASFAAILIYLFGSGVYAMLAMAVYSLLFILGSKNIVKEADRFVGFGLLTIVSSMLCNLYQVGHSSFSDFGGLVGRASVQFLYYFDFHAKLFLTYGLFFIATVLLLRYSHLMVARLVIKAVSAITDYCIQLDHMPARMIRSISAAIASACYAVGRLLGKAIDLLNGKFITNLQSSIVEFEREEAVDKNVDELMQDLFGQESDIDESLLQQEEQQQFEDQDLDPQKREEYAVEYQDSNVQDRNIYSLPDIETMLSKGSYEKVDANINKTALDSQAMILEEKLAQFGIKGNVVRVHPGPVITLFEYAPDSKIKLSKIVALEDDLAMALQAINIRILAPIPGKAVVGFEVANKDRKSVLLADIFHSSAWTKFSGYLPLILGEDTHGDHMVVDLASMPHVLIAGSTGSGKSVALNCMLVSLLCAKSPEDFKLVIIDPKQLEFSAYEDIPHLLFPIITDSKKAVPVLRWLVTTMEQRYEMMSEYGVRNIFEYQKLAKQNKDLEAMPFIVVMIDELADLMMTTGKDAEDLIARIAQMSRAAGIHMIVATQRPSVDVITGLIKVNFPNRISFKVTSKVDSRTILDEIGAERLLGKGDMLFIDAKNPDVKRVHGAYVSDQEINFLVQHVKDQQQVVYHDLSVLMESDASDSALLDSDQELYKDVVEMIQDVDEISISMVQRRFRIGYNRSARIIEALEAHGHILPSDGSKMRRVVKDS